MTTDEIVKRAILTPKLIVMDKLTLITFEHTDPIAENLESIIKKSQ